MRICQIELRNFRGIRKGTVVLPKHAVLLGANNAGKSTIVEALALLFAREKMVRPTSDWDFSVADPHHPVAFILSGQSPISHMTILHNSLIGFWGPARPGLYGGMMDSRSSVRTSTSQKELD